MDALEGLAYTPGSYTMKEYAVLMFWDAHCGGVKAEQKLKEMDPPSFKGSE